MGNDERDTRSNCRVLVVEDDYLIATEVAKILEHWNIEIIGPFATVGNARSAVSTAEIDYALVDLNLGTEMSFHLLDVLMQREVPVLLVTGYDPLGFPAKYRTLPLLQKPFSKRTMTSAFVKLTERDAVL